MTSNYNDKPLFCSVCARPLKLVEDTVSDENGHPVHEDCYVEALVSKRPQGVPTGNSRLCIKETG